jgi:hypothetical protein
LDPIEGGDMRGNLSEEAEKVIEKLPAHFRGRLCDVLNVIFEGRTVTLQDIVNMNPDDLLQYEKIGRRCIIHLALQIRPFIKTSEQVDNWRKFLGENLKNFEKEAMHKDYETTWILMVHLCGRTVLIEFKDKLEMLKYQKKLDKMSLTYMHTSVLAPKDKLELVHYDEDHDE